MYRSATTYPLAFRYVSILCIAGGIQGFVGSSDISYNEAPNQQEKEKRLREWTMGSSMDRVNRVDPKNLDPDRRVVALTGITGSGKSSCGNVSICI